MNKVCGSALLGLLLLVASCQSSDQVISGSVEKLNYVCPIEFDNKVGSIEKVEYNNSSIIFTLVLNKYTILEDDLSNSAPHTIESDPEITRQVFSQCFSDIYVMGAFKNVTQAMAQEVNLSFRAICKEEDSPNIYIFEIPWSEVIAITKYVLRK